MRGHCPGLHGPRHVEAGDLPVGRAVEHDEGLAAQVQQLVLLVRHGRRSLGRVGPPLICSPPPPPPPRVTFRRVAVSLRGPGQSPVLPSACCVGSLRFCRPLRPVLLRMSFLRLRSPVGVGAVLDVAGCAVCAPPPPPCARSPPALHLVVSQ